MKSLGEWDFLEAINGISAATLVVTGDYDPISASALAATSNAIQKCRIETEPDAGHFVFVEQPEWLKVTLCDFLSGPAGEFV